MPDEIELAQITGGKDEKTGIKNYSLKYWVRNAADIETVGERTYEGVPIINRSWATWDHEYRGAGYEVDLNYEGSSEDDENGEVWSFEVGFQDIEIDKHPNIGEIVSHYGLKIENGKVVIPAKESEVSRQFGDLKNPSGRVFGQASGFSSSLLGSGDLSLGLSESASGDKLHPLFGEKTITFFYSIASREFYADSINASFADAGQIFNQLPGNGPKVQFKYGENWIKRFPSARSSGDGYTITETFWSSLPGGWKEGIHNII